MAASPNTIKEELLKRGFPQAAMVLDALYSSGVVDFGSFGIDAILGQFLERNLPIGQSIVRRGMRDLARLGLAATKLIMLRTKGRPGFLYRLASPSGMAQILGVKLRRDENADSVPVKAYKSVRDFRAALHRELINRMPGKYSRQWLGERLGVTKRTTWNYEIDSDIVAQEDIDREPLSQYDIQFAPKKRVPGRFFIQSEYYRDMTPEEKDKAWSWVAPEERQHWSRKVLVTLTLPYTAYILKRELELGRKVFKAWQSTNVYSIAC